MGRAVITLIWGSGGPQTRPPPKSKMAARIEYEAALSRRSQLAAKPARRFPGFHRIRWLDHALMNIIASGAFVCSDVEAVMART